MRTARPSRVSSRSAWMRFIGPASADRTLETGFMLNISPRYLLASRAWRDAPAAAALSGPRCCGAAGQRRSRDVFWFSHLRLSDFRTTKFVDRACLRWHSVCTLCGWPGATSNVSATARCCASTMCSMRKRASLSRGGQPDHEDCRNSQSVKGAKKGGVHQFCCW